ncbi:hypothetical protein Anas_06815 [Armadillidium nasatum]|uniref:Mitochondria-eating protein n=1 Tax=Armadillidium nasatum TaxID=96803 RepID=A0A5N5TK21_9CRUS|nr:hypothetical protein Anas_06815 [Armadillidium nasatum]
MYSMFYRMGDNAIRGVTERTYPIGGSCNPPRIENLSLGDKRPSALVRRYAHLYDQTRLDALDALDALPDLRQADELKAKLLYSVVVLAFRSVFNTANSVREEVRNLLQMVPPSSDNSNNVNDSSSHQSKSVELAISSYCAHNIDSYDLTKNVEEVCDQIWATLYDYPCLKSSEALLQYAKACVRVAWGLVNQSPPFVIEYETRTFRDDFHVRFHTSDPSNDVIKSYLWPALLEGVGGKCVHQGVVIT